MAKKKSIDGDADEIIADAKGKKDRPQAERIMDALNGAHLSWWHDADGRGFCTIPRKGHNERYRVRSGTFVNQVRLIYPGAVSEKTMRDVQAAADALALRGPELAPAVRVTRWNGAIVIDLGRPGWGAIEVTAGGWRLIDSTDAPLIRPPGMRPLPIPMRGDRAEALRALQGLVNIESDRHIILAVEWMLAALWPEGPYPIASIVGAPGAAKSTGCAFLRNLVDPNGAPLRAPPRRGEDLIIAAHNSHVVGYDNLSGLSDALSDDLCRVATGAGFSKRQLYSDADETIIQVCAPVILNGVNDFMLRSDLASRALYIGLAEIPDDQRKTERRVKTAFAEGAPLILGLLLDGMATAMGNLPIEMPALPRMADFAELACAAAPAFGWTAEQVIQALEENGRELLQAVGEGDPVVTAIIKYLNQQDGGKWEGTTKALLFNLDMMVGMETRRERGWPADAIRMAGRLRRIASALRAMGVDVELPTPTGGGRANQRLLKLAIRDFGSRDGGNVDGQADGDKPESAAQDAPKSDEKVVPFRAAKNPLNGLFD